MQENTIATWQAVAGIVAEVVNQLICFLYERLQSVIPVTVPSVSAQMALFSGNQG